MTEPDVTLTDYALFVLCTICSWRIIRTSVSSGLRWEIVAFFLSIGAAALAGGTVHGFFLDESMWGYKILWRVTLVAIGLTAIVCFRLCWKVGRRDIPRIVTALLVIYWIAFAILVIWFRQDFWLAIVSYAPAIACLGTVGVWRWVKQSDAVGKLLFVAVLLSCASAVVQLYRLSIHPVYFNHNASYHLIQAIGLYWFYRALSKLVHEEGGRP